MCSMLIPLAVGIKVAEVVDISVKSDSEAQELDDLHVRRQLPWAKSSRRQGVESGKCPV